MGGCGVDDAGGGGQAEGAEDGGGLGGGLGVGADGALGAGVGDGVDPVDGAAEVAPRLSGGVLGDADEEQGEPAQVDVGWSVPEKVEA